MPKTETTPPKRTPGPKGFFRAYGSIARQLYVEKGLKPDGIREWLTEQFPGVGELPSAKTIERWATKYKWADDQAFFATSPGQMARDFQQVAAKWISGQRRLASEDPGAFLMITDLGDQMAKIAKSLSVIQRNEDPRRDMVSFLDRFVPFVKSLSPDKENLVWFSEMVTSYQETLA